MHADNPRKIVFILACIALSLFIFRFDAFAGIALGLFTVYISSKEQKENKDGEKG